MQIVRQSDIITFIINIYKEYLTFEFNHINQSIKVKVSFDEFNNQLLNRKMIFDEIILDNVTCGYAEFNLNKIFFDVHILIDEILDCIDNDEYNDFEEDLDYTNTLIPHQSSLTDETY